MIFVLAGTREGRELAATLVRAGHRVMASAVTPYGAELLRQIPGVVVWEGALNAEQFAALIKNQGIKGILDATHPFATEITRLAQEAAARCGVPYLRWERPETPLPRDHPLIHLVETWEEAVLKVASLSGRRVFLAVGVKPLSLFLTHTALRGRQFTVRVLPLPESLRVCYQLGLRPDQIVALQGPGTQKMNEALLEEYQTEVLVTKESGDVGGTKEKVAAACALGIPVVVVQRPVTFSGGTANFERASDVDYVCCWAKMVSEEKVSAFRGDGCHKG